MGHDFDDKFIAFIDVLGFKSMVENAEGGKGLTLDEIKQILSQLGNRTDKQRFAEYGPTTCPQSHHIDKNLNFEVTQISDCAIVSSEISPAGAINLINHCWMASLSLLTKGVLVRGYITRGSIYHKDDQVIGSGYQKAFSKESQVSVFQTEADERGTPFIEIDQLICDYIANQTDTCARTMFDRYVRTSNGDTAIFPFKVFNHSFVVTDSYGNTFSPTEEKLKNDDVRKALEDFKSKLLLNANPSNERAMKKTEHYVRALDAQIADCDKTDEMIDFLERPWSK